MAQRFVLGKLQRGIRKDSVMNELPYWVPYCGHPVNPEMILAQWNLDPWLLGALLVLLIGGWRHKRTTTSQRAAFALAWVLLVATLVGPLCNLASALFGARVTQHLIMIQIAAPLFVISGVGAAWLRKLRHPSLLWAVHGVLIWLWHLPLPYEAALRSVPILWIMHATLMLTAIAAWYTLLCPRDDAMLSRALLGVFATSVHLGMLGAILTFAPEAWHSYHHIGAPLWNLSALQDQQLAGLMMWVVGCTLYFGVALWILGRWLQRLDLDAERVAVPVGAVPHPLLDDLKR